MLTGIHFILTYTCNLECDHCFLYCSPRSQGTFTIKQVTKVLDEAEKMGTVQWIFYEGGEPFLFFPLLIESVRRAHAKGFKVGVVTNAHGAHSEEDAELWLKPLVRSGMSYLSISNDGFHFSEEAQNPATIASSVARRMGIDSAPICIEPPAVKQTVSNGKDKGRPIVDGGAMFRGRAVEKLSGNLPVRPWKSLCECPYEELVSPDRVHVDPYGNVMICQGISMGNMWMTPLADLVTAYRPSQHPICGPLIKGGPAALADAFGLKTKNGYVDECHLCYWARKAMLDSFPDHLAPRQVYGVD